MNRCLVALLSLLALATGCRHASLPTLPASHGHLSLAVNEYLELPTLGPGSPTLSDLPHVEVEPAQAPTVFAEAVQALKGHPTEQQVHDAAEDLGAACDVPFQPACDFLHEQFQRPERLEGKPLTYPEQALRDQVLVVASIRCELGVDGLLHACEVLESGPYGFTEIVTETSRTFRYRPAMLAGHPLSLSYTVTALLTPTTRKPTQEEYLQWYRTRTQRFPKSSSAWFGLAKTLAMQLPENPEYLPALRHLNELEPHFWWPANELAWAQVQAGKYPDALPLVGRARREQPLNPYVLETSAATLAGTGKCAEAVAEQQRAVNGLPAEWPQPERERFQLKLQEYMQHCPTAPKP